MKWEIMIFFRNKLAQVNWDNAFSFDNINTTADIITEHIITAAQESIPNKTVFIRPNEPEWINSNIKRQIRQRKRLFRRVKRINSQYAWYKFRRKRNEVTENIRQAKRNYSQTSIIRSVRDRQIFFELSVVRIFEIGTFRKCSVVFVRY